MADKDIHPNICAEVLAFGESQHTSCLRENGRVERRLMN